MLTNLILLSMLVTTPLIPNKVRIADYSEARVYYLNQLEWNKNQFSKKPPGFPFTFEDYDTLYNDDGVPRTCFGSVNWWAQKFSPGIPCTLKKALIMTNADIGISKESGNLYIWGDASGMPGEILAGPIGFQGGSSPNWEEIEIPNLVIAEDFWVGFYTHYPPYPYTDQRYDFRGRIAYSENGNDWNIAEDFFGDLMLRVLCVLTGDRHDVAIWEILTSSGPLLPIESDITVSAVVQNLGNVGEDSCPIVYTVYNMTGNPIIGDTMIVSLAVRQIANITFPRRWHTTTTGEYRIVAENLLPGDVIPENDSKGIKSFVHIYPSTLYYDDGGFELVCLLGVDSVGRFAMKFTPPYYPCRIESLKLYLLENQKALGLIFDDDGPGSEPGRILAKEEFTATARGWYTIDFSSHNIMINSGSFYAAYQNPPGETCESVGDVNGPLTGLDWTYFDYFWIPEQGTSEFGIRVCVNYPVHISEEESNKRSQFKILTKLVKAPIRFSIYLNGKTVLTVYNLHGQVCRRWVLEGTGMSNLLWNLSDETGARLPPGIYFVILTSKSENIREKIVLLQ